MARRPPWPVWYLFCKIDVVKMPLLQSTLFEDTPVLYDSTVAELAWDLFQAVGWKFQELQKPMVLFQCVF